MSNEKQVLFGALLGTALGSLAVTLYPQRKEIMNEILKQKENLKGKSAEVIDYLNQAFPGGKVKENNDFGKGSLLGFLAGASAMALLSPTSGKKVRDHIGKTFKEVSANTQDYINVLQKKAKAKTKVKKQVKAKIQAKKRQVKKAVKRVLRKVK